LIGGIFVRLDDHSCHRNNRQQKQVANAITSVSKNVKFNDVHVKNPLSTSSGKIQIVFLSSLLNFQVKGDRVLLIRQNDITTDSIAAESYHATVETVTTG
jgi:hypothetical protein